MSYTADVSMFPYWKTPLKDMKDELYDLREFKKEAEDTCAAHVVMEDLMKQLSLAQSRCNHLEKAKEKVGEEMRKRQTRIDELESEVVELTHTLEHAGNFKCQSCNVWCHNCSAAYDQPFDVLDYAGDTMEFCQDCFEDSDKVGQCDRCSEYCVFDFIADYQGNNYCHTCEREALEEETDEDN